MLRMIIGKLPHTLYPLVGNLFTIGLFRNIITVFAHQIFAKELLGMNMWLIGTIGPARTQRDIICVGTPHIALEVVNIVVKKPFGALDRYTLVKLRVINE